MTSPVDQQDVSEPPDGGPDGPLTVEPFAMILHRVIFDQRVSFIGRSLFSAIVAFAKNRGKTDTTDKQLAEAFGLSLNCVSKQLGELEALGLIRRESAPNRRRTIHVLAFPASRGSVSVAKRLTGESQEAKNLASRGSESSLKRLKNEPQAPCFQGATPGRYPTGVGVIPHAGGVDTPPPWDRYPTGVGVIPHRGGVSEELKNSEQTYKLVKAENRQSVSLDSISNSDGGRASFKAKANLPAKARELNAAFEGNKAKAIISAKGDPKAKALGQAPARAASPTAPVAEKAKALPDTQVPPPPPRPPLPPSGAALKSHFPSRVNQWFAHLSKAVKKLNDQGLDGQALVARALKIAADEMSGPRQHERDTASWRKIEDIIIEMPRYPSV